MDKDIITETDDENLIWFVEFVMEELKGRLRYDVPKDGEAWFDVNTCTFVTESWGVRNPDGNRLFQRLILDPLEGEK